ncbi:acid protease [Piedraia hortae CBS 480.64]|uniref:Acid protease n=1 Tax=Piedraia hortae CBS 480.64 TaxID=1314780 RepID=A0A6A7C005_9PEZI|nr:acid protease [Piedraia hortae CBS 480.64]
MLFNVVLATTLASLGASSPTRVPLRQHPAQPNAVRPVVHALHKHAYKGAVASKPAPETLDSGFWFGSFDVGNAKNLSLLIDTGSSDVAVNPGLYKPGSESSDLQHAGDLGYATVNVNGCGKAKIHYNTFEDAVTQGQLTAHKQALGNIVATPPPDNGTITTLPHDGLVGFGVPQAGQTQMGGKPFFSSLCEQKSVDKCRFGLAYGTDGTGAQILGGVDNSLFDGDLKTSSSDTTWNAQCSVKINNKDSVSENQKVLFDSGTANVVGPPSQVRQLFSKLGIQAVEQNLPGCTSVLFGYYDCAAPPTVGFTIGDETFNIAASAFQQAKNGPNNCTAVITGIDFGSDFWIVGQAWFQGKYVDFDVDHSQIGVASLRKAHQLS